MKYLSSPFRIALAALLVSCAPSLDIPPAPDVEPLLASFESPSATVVADIMAEVADEIGETRDAIVESDFYLELLEVIAEVQGELDESIDENGDLDLGGVTFPTPNGAVDIDFICDGWDPTQLSVDPADGAMRLTMTLAGGEIEPLVWGEVEDCKFLTEVGSEALEVSYNGDVGVYFGELFSPRQNLYELLTTFIIIGTLTIEGEDIPVEEAFEIEFAFDDFGNVALSRLEILVLLRDGSNFIYFFETDAAQGIIDATGTYECSLEEGRCAGPTGSFSW